MFAARNALYALTCVFVAACGGGGGGGSSSSSGGNPPPPPAAGSFTLSATTATFRAPRTRAAPASQSLAMTITGNNVAAVAATMPAAQAVPWLTIGVTGTAPNFTITLQPNSTQLNLGIATTTVAVATTDAAGAVLVSRDILVSYEIYQGITIPGVLAPQAFTFGGTETANSEITVSALGRNYSLTSSEPWLTVPAGVQSSNGPIGVGYNVAALIPGQYLTRIVATSTADPADNAEIYAVVNVVPPTFTSSASTMLLGGEDGLGTPLSGTLDLSLNTGANNWPWTVQVQGFSVPAALTTPVTSGLLSGNAGATFTLGADRAQLRPGTYTAMLHFATTIKGLVFTRDVPLTLNWESQRLVPAYDGLAFSSSPSRVFPPARQIVIADSRGRAGIPWTAVVDAQWLHVSPTSGVTGDTLTVSVTPGGLFPDSLYDGTIVLNSTSPVVERPEAIRVALWKSSTNPVNVSRQLTDAMGSAVASPVEPWVFTISKRIDPQPGGIDGQVAGIIRVYHVFTGDLLATYPSVTTYPGSMTISSNGLKLFVTDYATPRTIEIDALTGAQLASYPASHNEYALRDERHGIEFLRMNGRPVVWPAFSPYLAEVLPIDVETGQGLQSFVPGPGQTGQYSPSYDVFQAASPDGQFQYYASTASSASLSPIQQYFSVLGGGPRIRSVAGTFYARGNGVQDVCVSPGNKVWHSNGYMPMTAYDSHLENVVATFVMPANWRTINLICGAHGRNYVWISDNNGTIDENLAIFNDSGTLLGTYRHGPPGALLGAFRLKLSGDGTRIFWPSYGIVNNHLVDTLEISTPP